MSSSQIVPPPGILLTGPVINSLDEYSRQGGLEGFKKARTLSPQAIIDEVKKSGLRGRGGAGFPTGIKWQSVSDDPAPKKYVVCNGSEGEPGTYKDRYLIRKNPYPLVEGMLIASRAVGAEEVFIGLKAKFTIEVGRVRKAIAEFEEAGLMPKGYLNIVLGPDEYLFGEEKALLEVVDGRGAMPRIMPPYQQGIKCSPSEYNPTVVNNVETMSNLAHILAKGADWFRTFGSKDSPGTMIFTLSGDVKYPGMYELPMGTPLRDLLEKFGGGPAGDKPLRAVFSGVASRVITPDQFDTPLDFGSMKAAGSGLGSGGFMVYDESVSMVKIARLISEFLAKESCGQCIPCNAGCRNITQYLEKFESNHAVPDDLENILIECRGVTNQTRCFLPAEESAVISSIIQKFPGEFAPGKVLEYSRQPELWKIMDFNEETRTFRIA